MQDVPALVQVTQPTQRYSCETKMTAIMTRHVRRGRCWCEGGQVMLG
jgi:hypothetical protein